MEEIKREKNSVSINIKMPFKETFNFDKTNIK